MSHDSLATVAVNVLILTAMEVERRAVRVGVRRYQQRLNPSNVIAKKAPLAGEVGSAKPVPKSAVNARRQLNVNVELFGVGAESVGRRLPSIIKSVQERSGRIDRILLVGFSGGLTSEMQPGDVIVADQIVNADTHEVIAVPTHEANLERDNRLKNPDNQGWRTGSIITTNRTLATTDAKQAMRAQVQSGLASAQLANDCLAVDMESFAVASMIRDAGLLDRLTVARIIIDPFDMSLPAESNHWLSADGRARPMRVRGRSCSAAWAVAKLLSGLPNCNGKQAKRQERLWNAI